MVAAEVRDHLSAALLRRSLRRPFARAEIGRAREDAQVRMNVYPGLLSIGGFSPGLLFALDRDRDAQLGIMFDASPFFPLGLSTGF